MAGLITVAQLEARLKLAFTGDAATQASALIDDASDIVRGRSLLGWAVVFLALALLWSRIA